MDINMYTQLKYTYIHIIYTIYSQTTVIGYNQTFKLIFIGVQLLYNVVLVSAVQQSESVIYIQLSLFFGFPSHLGHHRALSRVQPNFFFFCLSWVFVAAHGGYSLLRCAGFSLLWLLFLPWLLFLLSTGSRHAGFSSCGSWAQQLWRVGLVAPQHVRSSQTPDRTRVP